MTHDVAGNLTLDPLACNAGQTCGTGVPPVGSGQRYEYDEENRVVAVYNANGTAATGDDVLSAKYEYDALGRRVHTIEYVDAATGAALATPRKTRHVYVGLETAEELDVSSDANGNDVNTIQLREFLWGDSGRFPEPLAMVDWTEAGEQSECIREVVYYLHDVLGSVVGLTNEDGEFVERYTYDPYGRTYVETSDGEGGWTGGNVSLFGNPWLWTGQRYDAGTRLYAFWFRMYSPALGRWLQRDPIGYVGGVSLYKYVMGAPLSWLDPLGLDPVPSWLPPFNQPAPTSPMGPPAPPPAGEFMIELWVIPFAEPYRVPASSVFPAPTGYFTIAQRPVQRTDWIGWMANIAGGEHTYIEYHGGGGSRWGWGWGTDGTNQQRGSTGKAEGQFGATTQGSCERGTGVLQHGTGAKNGKTGTNATDEEIMDCIKNHPASKDYGEGWLPAYRCRQWALEAAAACGLNCKG